MKSTISVFALAMLITGSIDSIRNLAATALFGTALPFFFILASLLFLLPLSFVSAELSANLPGEGGIFAWVERAFGVNAGMVAIWLLWINTMIYFPTILSFIASTAMYFMDPHWAQNKTYLITVMLIIIWGLTVVNLKGLKESARFATFCAVVGMVIPMFGIMFLALLWLFFHHPIAIHFSTQNLLPNLKESNSWSSLTAIVTSFLGMELASVHVTTIKNAQQKFPKALMLSVLFITVTMLFGSLSIALVLPADTINLLAGLMQAFSKLLAPYHLSFILPLVTLMILIGSVGGMINWLISPAKGLFQAGHKGFLPHFFRTLNANAVPDKILITQALLISLLCLVFVFLPNINTSYWLLTDMSTELYLFMYVLMFSSALILPRYYVAQTDHFRLPMQPKLTQLLCLLGLLSCLIAIVIGFIPPAGITQNLPLSYPVLFGLGLLLMCLPLVFLYAYRRNALKKQAGLV